MGSILIAALAGLPFGLSAWTITLAFAGHWIYQSLQLHRLNQGLLHGLSPSALPQQGVVGALSKTINQLSLQPQRRLERSQHALNGIRRVAMDFPYPLVVINAKTQHLTWFNRAATELLGLNHPADLNQPPYSLLEHPELGPWINTGSRDLLTVDSPQKSGTRLRLRTVVFDHEHTLIVGEDITQLIHLEQVRRDFVANVSHELRTPLTVIHGYLELISPEDNPELNFILPEMRNQSQRMTRIVEDLLTISRLEAQQELVLERVVMASMLQSLEREALALSRGQHHISSQLLIDKDLSGSPADLHSAFSNLVSNAVRYTPSGGRICIRFEATASGARFSVTDTGHGIPSSHIPRLVERFYRVSSSRSRERGGTGLGLSIVKHVLNLHDARLTIDSEVGRGSVFACEFDAAHLIPSQIETHTDELD